jgi:hypothetical protein
MLKKIAVLDLNNSLVVNVVMAENAESAKSVLNSTCIELPEDSLVGIDWQYSDETKSFTNPIIESID